jgi:hypothetical protein
MYRLRRCRQCYWQSRYRGLARRHRPTWVPNGRSPHSGWARLFRGGDALAVDTRALTVTNNLTIRDIIGINFFGDVKRIATAARSQRRE